ncbi:hypothetical protein [Sphingomonas fuzhouensis]|uniref:hypothetical protein n=1 Tax=Sphingomonas fuzhouensis TaxID=3106033 RepID=UPI002AFDCEF5|nr:hypothetical protein [Sphingomonas sp. SGZ-02]
MTMPLLIRHACDRTSRGELPGAYDDAARLWLVDGEQGPRPLASSGDLDGLEILTKTRVRQEADDEEFSLLEITTKTAVNQEGDDQKTHAAGLELQIVTKTDVQQEADDQIGQPGLDLI